MELFNDIPENTEEKPHVTDEERKMLEAAGWGCITNEKQD